MPAQNLPSLPADGKIQRGTLQCGASYYMVNNPEVKGYADIAVVQRDESPSGLTRKRLSTSFFARRGVGPRPTGYFREQDGSTILNFDHVPVYETAVLDSALLSTFSLMAGSRAEQAVIVSGDIDPVELKKKMDILSMLVPKRYGKPVGSQDYVWEPSVSPTITLEKTPGKSRASVKVAYASPRTRQEYMNTAQALVMDILSREFLTVASRRIRRGLENAGIPYGSLETRYLSSAETSGDEEFALIVHTDPAHLQAAMKVISSSLAGLDGFGIPEEEFTDTKQVMMADMIRRGEAPLSNREYTDRCIAHFLYGASLAPYSEQTQLFARKNLPDSTQTRLFNRFTTSLLSQLSNLTLTYRAPLDSLDEDDALFQYNLAYLYGSTFQDAQKYDWRWTDTLSLEAQCPKVRLSSTRKDAVSGGELWTFSNGVRVVYKQVPGSGMFSYALLLHGGLASIDGLAEGEGGYFRDMLSLYNVAGIPSMRFRDFLDVSGIQMQADVMSTCMTLRGSAPGQKLQTLFKCLLALANERTPNRSAFDTFAQNTALEEESMEDRMTGYLEPGWTLNARRDPAALTPGTQAKAEKYFEGRFSRVDDGVIVLCGDLDETTLKRVLMRYVGGFRTGRGTTGRPGVKPRTLTGTHTLTGTEPGSGVWVLMDAEYPLTGSSYQAVAIAQEVLRRSLVRSLEGTGVSAQVSCKFLSYPKERIRMHITCRPVPPQGRAEDMPEPQMLRCIDLVRGAIRSAASAPLSEKEMAAFRAMALADTRSDLSDPSTLVTAVITRYGVGKDFVSKYGENIGSLTSDRIVELLKALAEGARVEYVVP